MRGFKTIQSILQTMSKKNIKVQGVSIRLEEVESEEFVSLTDIAKNNSEMEPSSLVANWLRNRNTIAFLEAWEETFNPNFKPSQMRGFKEFAADNRSLITTKKYIDISGALGIISKSGRYGGTYAHKDIALEFCSWLSPRFKVAMIKTFQELMRREAKRVSLEWHLSKIIDNIDEVRNLLDTLPVEESIRKQLKRPK